MIRTALKAAAWLALGAAVAAGAQSEAPSIDAGDRARFERAVALSDSRPDEAISLFEALARDYPRWPEPYNNLAVLYAAKGEEKKAEEALLTAMKAHPSFALVHRNLESLYAAMAGRAYRKALQGTSAGATAPKLALADDIGFATVGASAAAPAPEAEIAAAAPAAPLPAAETRAPEASGAAEVEERIAAAPEPPRAAEPAPASPPEPESGPATAAESPVEVRRAVLSTVASWLEAWSSQDVERYLSFYGHHFDPGGGVTRERWEAIRRKRVGSPEFIRIDIRNPSVTLPAGDRATVRFLQSYESNTFEGQTIKTLRLSRGGDGWKIVGEETGG